MVRFSSTPSTPPPPLLLFLHLLLLLWGAATAAAAAAMAIDSSYYSQTHFYWLYVADKVFYRIGQPVPSQPSLATFHAMLLTFHYYCFFFNYPHGPVTHEKYGDVCWSMN